MRKKKGICLMLAVVMAISTGFTALAADTKIDTVKLYIFHMTRHLQAGTT